jgi:hypothetical protein
MAAGELPCERKHGAATTPRAPDTQGGTMKRANSTRRPYTLVVLAALVILSLGASAAMAGAPASRLYQEPPPGPPPNDNFENSTLVTGAQFDNMIDNTNATMQDGEPTYCYMNGSVWYRIEPRDADVEYRLQAGAFDGVDASLTVWQGTALGSLNYVQCGYEPTLDFVAHARQTYYLQLGNAWAPPGTLTLSVTEVPAPPNDNFANALDATGQLPYQDVQPFLSATKEPNEPVFGCSPSWEMDHTVWYTYTPDKEVSLTAQLPDAGWAPLLGVYTGNALTNLQEVGCQNYNWLTFRAHAGVKYYFRVAIQYASSSGNTFKLYETPLPEPGFYWHPLDLSKYDSASFWDQSFDPVYMGYSDLWWDFGDGATATGFSAEHRFAADGDYTVWHKVQTTDGRTAEVTKTVQVRTHDVAITKVTVPQSASANQTRQIVVGLRNYLYPEQVSVELFKSVPGGWTQVGTLNQQVPVRSGNRTTDFNFSYTFTRDDASLGKVNFKAVATLLKVRDALPADNEAISLPTKVGKK